MTAQLLKKLIANVYFGPWHDKRDTLSPAIVKCARLSGAMMQLRLVIRKSIFLCCH